MADQCTPQRFHIWVFCDFSDVVYKLPQTSSGLRALGCLGDHLFSRQDVWTQRALVTWLWLLGYCVVEPGLEPGFPDSLSLIVFGIFITVRVSSDFWLQTAETDWPKPRGNCWKTISHLQSQQGTRLRCWGKQALDISHGHIRPRSHEQSWTGPGTLYPSVQVQSPGQRLQLSKRRQIPVLGLPLEGTPGPFCLSQWEESLPSHLSFTSLIYIQKGK